jgi:hypothetical protein
MVLPERQHVIMACREVAEVERYEREACDLTGLSLRQEAIGDAALVEYLDGARLQAAGARAGKVLVLTPLDDGDIDLR